MALPAVGIWTDYVCDDIPSVRRPLQCLKDSTPRLKGDFMCEHSVFISSVRVSHNQVSLAAGGAYPPEGDVATIRGKRNTHEGVIH
jgi:hypothetical protein